MATPAFKGILALAIIFFFGGIAMIVAGGVCIGKPELCVIPLGGSIATLVVGIALFGLSIAGFVILVQAWIGGMVYAVTR